MDELHLEPVTGCTKISAGCDNCYAERFSERFRGVANHPFQMGFDLTLRPERVDQPLRWKTPRMIFVNSMSDLFHKKVPGASVDRVFDTMERADWHTYPVLTKRSPRMRDTVRARYGGADASAQVWLGVPVENGSMTSRIRHLADTPVPIRFLSIEPLLGPMGDLPLDGIGWVIVGGESGPRARPVDPDWIRSVRDPCIAAEVPFFFKQWGGRRAKSGGRMLDRTMRVLLLAAASVVAAVAFQALPCDAQTFDAFKQYSIKKNPAGAWSYVAAGQLMTATSKTCNGIKKEYCWTNGGNGFPNVAADEANKTGGTIEYADVVLPPNYLDFDPEGVSTVAFQWTAPASGTAKVTGNFLGVATDEGSHEVAVLHNGQSLASYTMSTYQQKNSFKLTVSVAKGDTIALTSYTGNGGGALSTGLQARIVLQ